MQPDGVDERMKGRLPESRRYLDILPGGRHRPGFVAGLPGVCPHRRVFFRNRPQKRDRFDDAGVAGAATGGPASLMRAAGPAVLRRAAGNARNAPAGLSRRPAFAYPIPMMSLADPRVLRRFTACLVLSTVLSPDLAAAQGSPFTGFTALPSFAWPQPAGTEGSRWAGSFARMSTGFEVSSSKHFGSYAGPTVGFEGGRMWQEGRLVYGVVGGFNYLAALGGGATPGVGGLAYSRDFSGALQLKVGALLTPDVLLYAKAGASALHQKLEFAPSPSSLPFAREDIAVQPDVRAGVEWAVTDRLSLSVEAGVTGRGLR
jgi:opacity protein-like surface antigen